MVRDRAALGVLAIGWRDPVDGVSLRLSAMIELLAAEAAVAISRADLLGRLEHLARTDELTGLPNRRHWEQQLPRELARAWRDERRVCVAMLDLDHFKDYNDRRGHQAGDRLLREPPAPGGPRCGPTTSSPATAARSSASSSPAARSASGGAGRAPARGDPGGRVLLGGLAEWDAGEQADALVGRADAALYRAKRAAATASSRQPV